MMFDSLVCSIDTSLITPKRRLAGKVSVEGLSAKKRVVVHHRGTNEYVASTVSDPDTGNWEIRGLPIADDESLIVFYIDDTRSFNPIAFDYVSQEV